MPPRFASASIAFSKSFLASTCWWVALIVDVVAICLFVFPHLNVLNLVCWTEMDFNKLRVDALLLCDA